MTKRTFYRSVITVEILSEEPLGDLSLSAIDELITDGPCSGKMQTIVDNEPVDGPRMAQLLLEQASEPEFFQLDEEGNDLTEGDDETDMCQNPNCDNPEAGYPCAICGKNTCVSCDTYYYVVDESTGEYITDANVIMRVADLDGNVAHQDCVDPTKEINADEWEQSQK